MWDISQRKVINFSPYKVTKWVMSDPWQKKKKFDNHITLCHQWHISASFQYVFHGNISMFVLLRTILYPWIVNIVLRAIRAPGPLFTKWMDILPARSDEVWKLRDSSLDFFNHSEIWRAPRQHRCRNACQISEWYDHYSIQSCGFETSNKILR